MEHHLFKSVFSSALASHKEHAVIDRLEAVNPHELTLHALFWSCLNQKHVNFNGSCYIELKHLRILCTVCRNTKQKEALNWLGLYRSKRCPLYQSKSTWHVVNRHFIGNIFHVQHKSHWAQPLYNTLFTKNYTRYLPFHCASWFFYV